jgi:hypothetical protein
MGKKYMNKGDKVTVKRGPLAGMEITLARHDNANRAWFGTLTGGMQIRSRAGEHGNGLVMVWDYELTETLERPERKEVVDDTLRQKRMTVRAGADDPGPI